MLSCPVCGDSVSSLEKLNLHLDSEHPVTGEEETNNGFDPFIVDRTKTFTSVRKRNAERLAISRTRLELRLIKLLTGLQALSRASTTESTLWNWRDISATRKFEMEVVNWEDESVFERCRFCGQRFSFFVRKHHCRVCGLVTCGDVERECSLEVPAVLLAQKMEDMSDNFPDLKSVTTDFPIRMCTECRTVLFSHRNYKADVKSVPPKLLRLHYQLEKMQTEVVSQLPQFEELLTTLTSHTVPDNDIARVRQSRQVLLKLFSKYESLSRKLRDIPVETETEIRLRSQMLAKAAVFLESSMLPLQSLPQAMRYNEPKIQNKSEAANLQNKLVVLEEQRFLLEQQISQAKQNRQFDVLLPMEASLAEITSEVAILTSELGQYAPTT